MRKYPTEYFYRNPPLLLQNEEGKVIPNPLLEKTVPYWLNFDRNAAGGNRLLLAANGAGQTTMTNDGGADIEIYAFTGSADNDDYTFQVFDNQIARTLFNRFIHAKTLIGTGKQPFLLPTPIVLLKTQQISINVQNGANANNTLGIGQSYLSTRYYWDYEKHAEKFGIAPSSWRAYFYTTDNEISLNPNANEDAFITFMADAYFYLQRITIFATQGEDTFNIEMSRLNSTLGMQNSVTTSETFAGNNIFHYDLPVPMVFAPKERVRLNITNRTANNNNIFITFSGANYYYKQGLGELS